MTNEMNKLPIVVSAMGLVIVDGANNDARVLVLESEGELMLPKGRVEDGEDIIETVIREVQEEAGVTLTRADHRGHVGSFGFVFEPKQIYKEIRAELFVLKRIQDIQVNREEGFSDGQWLLVDEAMNRLTHEDARDMLRQSMRMLSHHGDE